MSDISDVVSNERLEELAKGDMEVWYSESQSMARELLALRKERERAAPVAWRHDDGPFASGALTRSKSLAESWIGNGWKVTPLYTAPPAPVVTDGWKLVPEIPDSQMITAWKDANYNKASLESAFRKMVNAAPKPPHAMYVMDESQSRELFEKWCPVNIERNKWHPEIYSHLPARQLWGAWEACRAAMLGKPEYPLQVPDEVMACMAALSAAISLLERGGRKAAASDKMFEQMLVDYKRALNDCRAAMLNQK